MPIFRITVTYENETTTTSFYRLRDLSEFIKEHPLHGKRGAVPVLPWLLDLAFGKAKNDGIDSKVRKIDIKERLT